MMMFQAVTKVGDKFGKMPCGGGYYGSDTLGLLALVTWILVIAALVAFVRWIWKMGDKIR